MIGLVRIALRRPYTSAIAALLIVLMGALSITRMIVEEIQGAFFENVFVWPLCP